MKTDICHARAVSADALWRKSGHPERGCLLFLLLILIFFAVSSLYAKEDKTYETRHNLIYDGRYLINEGEKHLLRLEVVFPFYKYLGDLKEGQRINISYIKTRFTVQYTIKEWIGEYKTMKETFTPQFEPSGPDVGLEVTCALDKDTLNIKVTSVERISSVFIEILFDIPIKISNDRIRYVLSAIGVSGQNLKQGPEASFKLYLLSQQDYYKVPIQITYIFQGSVYERVFFYSFKKDDFNNVPTAH